MIIILFNHLLLLLLTADIIVFIVHLFDLYHWQKTKQLHCNMLAGFAKVGVYDVENYLNNKINKAKNMMVKAILIFFVLMVNLIVINLL